MTNCKDCEYSKKGYFKSKPDEYVCIGTPEPYIVRNDDMPCSYYKRDEDKVKSTVGEDCLIVTYDVGTKTDPSVLSVSKYNGNTRIELSEFKGNDAFAIYHLLTGGATFRDTRKEKIDDVVFQLRCIREHLLFLYQTEGICPIDFDIDVINGCISQLENFKEE